MNKYFIVLLAIGISVGVLGQTNKTEPAVKNTHTTSQKKVENLVKKQLKEVYGEEYDVYIKNQPEQIKFFTDFYLRCEFLPLIAAPSNVNNISTLNLRDKYNPGVIFHDNLNQFDQEKFNVLKYQFNYYNKEDAYFKIYNTDKVLKINKVK